MLLICPDIIEDSLRIAQTLVVDFRAGINAFVIAGKPSLSKGGTAMSRATLYNCNMLPEPDITKCNTALKRQKILEQSGVKACS